MWWWGRVKWTPVFGPVIKAYHGAQSDADTLEDSVNIARGHLLKAGSQASSPLKKQDFGVLWSKCWNESWDVSARFTVGV